jgi:hypothetical protein
VTRVQCRSINACFTIVTAVCRFITGLGRREEEDEGYIT